jgi:hypothetical protein
MKLLLIPTPVGGIAVVDFGSWSIIALVDDPSMDPRPNARPWGTFRNVITGATSSFQTKMLDLDSRSAIPLADPRLVDNHWASHH